MIPLQIETLIVNGRELRVIPTALSVQPMQSRTVANLPCGPVLVLWPGQDATLTLSAEYENLDDDDAEAMLALCTETVGPSNTLGFSRSGPVYACRSLRCELAEGERGWTASIAGVVTWVPL